MNLLKRLYCRLFQKIMYLAIPILPYREPELLKDYKEIVDVLKTKEIKSLMLMVSKSVCRYGYTFPSP